MIKNIYIFDAKIIYFIEYQANKMIELCSFLASLWQWAHFCCDSWRNSVVAVGEFSLWQLARFRCGSWRVFVVAVGEMLLGNIVLLYLRTFSEQIGKKHFEGIAKHFEVATKRRIVT